MTPEAPLEALAWNEVVTLAGVRAARDRIAASVRVTPTLEKLTLTERFGHPVHLKCEHLQRTGSFKLRGAVNLLSQLNGDERARGVVAASAGNHAQGVAVAAAEHGVRSTIYMPEDASLAKVEATRGYGADVVLEGANLSAALAAATARCERDGGTFVHPFDDARIISGQGTIGLEIAEQVPDVATVIVPVGGGGLFAGIAVAVRELLPGCRMVGVQSTACRSLEASLAAGHPVTVDAAPTLADGIAVKQTGGLPFGIVRDTLDELVHVDEEDLARAILWCMERAKQVVEGAGVAALAAILAGRVRVDGPAVVLLCGGNIDPMSIIPVLRHGLTSAGRFLRVRTVVPDRPGELSRLLALLAALKLNVLSVEHHREGLSLRVGHTCIDLTLQTRNLVHVEEALAALHAAGFAVTPGEH